MAVQQTDQEDPDNDPEPDQQAPKGFVEVWFTVRPLLQLVELLVGEQHEGLHLTVQALLVLGDFATVSWMATSR